MLDALSDLGIDVEDLGLFDLALCSSAPTNEHFDDYESDPNTARLTDARCLSCPIMVQCLQRAMDRGEWGTWGAIYLTNGKPDVNRNAHKTPEIWEEIRKRIGEQPLL